MSLRPLAELCSSEELEELHHITALIISWLGEQGDGNGEPVDPDFARFGGLSLLSLAKRAQVDSD